MPLPIKKAVSLLLFAAMLASTVLLGWGTGWVAHSDSHGETLGSRTPSVMPATRRRRVSLPTRSISFYMKRLTIPLALCQQLHKRFFYPT